MPSKPPNVLCIEEKWNKRLGRVCMYICYKISAWKKGEREEWKNEINWWYWSWKVKWTRRVKTEPKTFSSWATNWIELKAFVEWQQSKPGIVINCEVNKTQNSYECMSCVAVHRTEANTHSRDTVIGTLIWWQILKHDNSPMWYFIFASLLAAHVRFDIRGACLPAIYNATQWTIRMHWGMNEQVSQ